MKLQHSSSKIRAWVVRFLLIEIREASFINTTGPMSFSSLIVEALGFKFAASLIMNN